MMKISKTIVVCTIAAGLIMSTLAFKAQASIINDTAISASHVAPATNAGGGKDGQETHG